MTLSLDVERRLALNYVPARVREAVAALWMLDTSLGQVLSGTSDSMLARIKLAWWREALEALDRQPAPPQPTLQAVQRHLVPAGLTGAELAVMEEGWSVLATGDRLERDEIESHALRRGGLLFTMTARLLAGDPDIAASGGELWALADLARHSRDHGEAALALALGKERLSWNPPRWPKALRPLGMLASLARRDMQRPPDALERPGSPARMLAMMRHRLTGR